MAVCVKRPAPYHYIHVVVDFGELVVEARRYGRRMPVRLLGSEDVTDLGEEDVVAMVRGMLDVADDDPVRIQLRYN